MNMSYFSFRAVAFNSVFSIFNEICIIHAPPVFKNAQSQSQGDGQAVTNTCCSCRGLRFHSQHQPKGHNYVQLQFHGIHALFCLLQALHLCSVHTQTKGNIHAHKIKKVTILRERNEYLSKCRHRYLMTSFIKQFTDKYKMSVTFQGIAGVGEMVQWLQTGINCLWDYTDIVNQVGKASACKEIPCH